MNKNEQDYVLSAKAHGTEKTPPDSARVKEAFSRVGYALEESVADLIDNCIDAKASEVLVRFVHDAKQVQRIVIADNGNGMIEDVLREAMRFGSTLRHKSDDLGKYGIGLKAASFSQCDELSVVTRKAGKASGRRWSSASFGKDWLCEILEADDCSILLGAEWAGLDLRSAGTLVIWDKLSCLKVDGETSAAEAVEDAIGTLANHLGLVFHRFLDDGSIRIRIDSQLSTRPATDVVHQVEALDPFAYSQAGASNYPKRFSVSIDGVGEIDLHAHIWPKKSREQGFRLGGGKVSARQGFYFYRNNRLIQAGGWNGVRRDDAEPHLSLARVTIDLPAGINGFDVSIQKTKVNVPQGFIDATQEAESGSTKFTDYIAKADEVYRAKGGEGDDDFPLVPWQGLSGPARETARQTLARGEKRVRKVSFEWDDLDRGLVFEIDVDQRRIKLNEAYRKSLLNGGRRSKTDAQVIKTLIFFLVRNSFDKKLISRKLREEIEAYNQILLRCLK